MASEVTRVTALRILRLRVMVFPFITCGVIAVMSAYSVSLAGHWRKHDGLVMLAQPLHLAKR
jgi:hypothetical protein